MRNRYVAFRFLPPRAVMTDTHSVWAYEAPDAGLPALTKDTTADVCVIGGGIAGLTAAYRLLAAGRSVLLLDSDTPGRGETAHTTAHLAWVLDDRYSRLADVRGDDIARLAASSHQSAIADIERVARDEGIECDFARVFGYLFPGSDGPRALEAERDAVRRLGLDHAAVDAIPIVGGVGLEFPGQARFHPTKYLRGLVEAVRGRGVDIRAGTRVVCVTGGEPCTVETAGGATVTARAVVVATNAPFDAGLTLHARLAAYTTYAIALPIPAGSVPDALYWYTEDPYHYVRVLPASNGRATDLLIVGGEDHKTGQATDQHDRWARLRAWAEARFRVPGEPAFHWSGQVFETADGLGLIGAAPWGKNVYVVTGDSGDGTDARHPGRPAGGRPDHGHRDAVGGRVRPRPLDAGGGLHASQGERQPGRPVRRLADRGRRVVGRSDSAGARGRPAPGAGETRRVPQTGRVGVRAVGHVSALGGGGAVELRRTDLGLPGHGSQFATEGKVLHGPADGDLGVTGN